ncbi:MAG: tripartite tricarboxylate transporter substrate-binding protein [Alphaproteobacteria bacterium]|nr:tripartite tricarboxylate transporter substrate-binding protein [Alphaproteobacteria bacterium]
MLQTKANWIVALVGGVAMGIGVSTAAAAQNLEKPGGYPKRTVTILITVGTGGGTGQLARSWGAAMEKVTGVGFQVVSKPGGGGLAAIPEFMNRPADGYTILLQTDNLISAGAAKKVEYEIGEDIVPICVVQATFNQIYIRPDETRFTDWKSLVAYAKANPGKVSMGNIAREGSMERILATAMQQAAGIKVKQISFDRPSRRYGALLGGHIDILFEQPGDVKKFLEAKKMKPVLTFLTDRPPVFSDVPALPDVGMGSVPPLLKTRVLWLRKGVSEDRREYLDKACKVAFDSEKFQAFNKKKYMHVGRSYYNSSDAKKLIKGMIDTYREKYKEMGIIK